MFWGHLVKNEVGPNLRDRRDNIFGQKIGMGTVKYKNHNNEY